jgi:inner membrane protein
MDPIAHGLSGATLAASGLRRATPLGTAALVLGAVAPDVDALMMLAGPYTALAHRRGWTHGVGALVALPLVLTALLLLWERGVTRRRRPEAPPARAGTLLLLGGLGVMLHLAFDWVNNYGVRLLMPFDGRWFYGDALFVIDPWLWAILGGATFLTWSRRPASWALAGSGALLLSLPLFLTDLVGPGVRAVWGALLALVVLARVWLGRRSPSGFDAAPIGRAALVVTALYVGASLALNLPVERQVRAALAARGAGEVLDLMVAPVPAYPGRRFVVVEEAEGYRTATWDWFASPRLELAEGRISKGLDAPQARAAAATLDAQNFLAWSRYPYAVIEPLAQGHLVRFEDARYALDGGIRGPRVRVGAGR